MLGTVAIAAAVALLVSGCSEVGFPAVHDMPAPRADTTLTPDQVKQATDALINDRNHLSTEAQAATPTNSTTAQQKPTAQPAVLQQPAAAQAPAAGDTQTAGAYARP